MRTPPPDPTFTGYIAAYAFLFRNQQAAMAARPLGRQALLELNKRLGRPRGSPSPRIVRNALVLYLVDPAEQRAIGAQRSFERCLEDL